MSIQALVLCEKPSEIYVAARGEQDRVYNMQVRGYTVRRAILWWAKDPPALWKDQVDYHFRTNGNKILQTAEHWARKGRKKIHCLAHLKDMGRMGEVSRGCIWILQKHCLSCVKRCKDMVLHTCLRIYHVAEQ
jgi:hypothetical protein